MDVVCSELRDLNGWIALSREVESLFGPMADEPEFQSALRNAISQKKAFCIRTESDEKDKVLKGGIVISDDSNEIAWFVVSDQYRRKGYGKKLLVWPLAN